MFVRVNRVTKDIEVVFNAQVAAQLRLESAEILFSELGAAIEEVKEGEEPAEPVVEPEPAPGVEPEPDPEPAPGVEPEPDPEPAPGVEPDPEPEPGVEPEAEAEQPAGPEPVVEPE